LRNQEKLGGESPNGPLVDGYLAQH